jgi:two-component system sensor histidine kinase BarA
VGYKKLYDYLNETIRNDTHITPPSKIKSHSEKAISILIAEDDAINQRLYFSLLNKEKITICMVNNGLEAIEKANIHQYDLILLDLQMPKMGGIEASKHIRQSSGPNQNIPIIAVSANISNTQKSDLQKVQINDYIEKPFNEATLFSLILEWTTKNAIDWNECVSLMSGKEIVAKEMLDKFIDCLKEDKKALCDAKSKNAISALQAITHRLYGSSCYIGIPNLRMALKHLELLLNQKQYKLIDIVFQKVLDEINAVFYHYDNLMLPTT